MLVEGVCVWVCGLFFSGLGFWKGFSGWGMEVIVF